MRWKLCAYILCCLFIFSAAGCGKRDKGAIRFPRVENPGNTLVEYDPERRLYILCENAYSDVYLGSYAGIINFYILTRKPVAVDTISIVLPIENTYEVFVNNSADCQSTELTISEKGQTVSQNSANNALPYYVYQCYKGTDFAKMGSLAAASLYGTGNLEAVEDWQTLINAEAENFKSLKAEQIPEFYAYQVYAVIQAGSDKLAETIRSIDVTIGDKTYTKQIGQMNLIPDKIPTHAPIGSLQNTVVQQFYTHAVGTTQQLYSDGIGYEYLLEFTAPENLTLTALRILDEYTQVLDIELTLTKQDGTSTSFYWDGKSPVQVLRGEKLGLALYYRNPNMANLWYAAEMCVEVDYSAGDETECVFLRRTLYPIGINLHEAYAVIFAGLDMESYYRDFYYPVYEPWMQKYRTIEQEG